MQSQNNHYNYWKGANRLGLFLVILFIICFVWYYLRPVEQELHLKLLKMIYFGFSEMNLTSFILGLIQSYIWAYIIVGIWRLAGCCCCRAGDNK